ncbi:hypothetical protein NP233_g9288 [Leucocoprinus birnbaumii]|uniref:F-box domain-containing protein n=1 Tax=Leucocoprinus birnbaumii TaxID=56174 RepID=A0AAD5VKM9_9AGAR|nr:hypothetical protein NP233_g9288 [Leucocoprinus birnbaumii]
MLPLHTVTQSAQGQGRSNDLEPQSSPTPFLPTELLVIIFEWYAAQCCTFRSEAPDASAWSLGLVCKCWRNLALSMPLLWNHLPVIQLTEDTIQDAACIYRWKSVLERSGNAPLKLHLAFDIDAHDFHVPLQNALAPFYGCSSRWEHITITNLTSLETQILFHAVYRNIPLLQSATFNFSETTFRTTANNTFTVFQYAPKLRTILVHSPSHRHRKTQLHFPWDQLMRYKESGIDMGTFPAILGISPKLESLHYQGKNFTYHFSDFLHHNHLRHLSVDTGSLRVFWEQLRRVTIPSLESFSIVVSDKHRSNAFSSSDMIDFIARSGCSIKRLVIRLVLQPIRQDLIGLLLLTPDLESLEIGSCHTPFLEDAVLQALVFSRNYPMPILPRLSNLTLTYEEDPCPDDIDLISRIVSSRQELVVNDSDPGQLPVVLDHIRVVLPDTPSRFRAMCQLGKWVDPLLPVPDSYTQPFPGTIVPYFDPISHASLLFRAAQPSQGATTLVETIPPVMLSLFLLAHLTEAIDQSDDMVLAIESIKPGVTELIANHFIQQGWVPGSESDILYIHSNQTRDDRSEIWTHIMSRNTKALDEILGYQAHKEPEDDLREMKYSRPC